MSGSPARVQLPIETLRQLVDQFYAEDFRQLQYLVRARPEAQQIVKSTKDRGLRIVLATNPMFPLTAIIQRLEWAGLRASDFTHVTTLENSHACKPHARYFTEVLSLIGVEPREALMIGDDWQLDIAPAMALSLHAYWLNERRRQQPACVPRPDALGIWHEFVDWWQAIELLS